MSDSDSQRRLLVLAALAVAGRGSAVVQHSPKQVLLCALKACILQLSC